MAKRGKTMLACLVFAAGCTTVSSAARTANVTFPVCVGPVAAVRSNARVALGAPLERFDIQTENYSRFMVGEDGSSYEASKEGSNKFDVELLKMARPSDKVAVHRIYFGAYLGGIVFPTWHQENVWTGIEGATYRGQFGEAGAEGAGGTR